MIKVKFEKTHPDAQIPEYETEGSSGLDIKTVNKGAIPPMTCVMFETGLKIEVPPGYEGQIRSRSGLAYKNLITVLNSPGTIDSDYRGEIKVLLFNHDPNAFYPVKPGDRIAQLVICPIVKIKAEEVKKITSKSKRGDGGFGSTGR